MALDLARKLNSEENFVLANNILVVSVLAIVLTAPLGAILMIKLAPVWLKKDEEEEIQTSPANTFTGTNTIATTTTATTTADVD